MFCLAITIDKEKSMKYLFTKKTFYHLNEDHILGHIYADFHISNTTVCASSGVTMVTYWKGGSELRATHVVWHVQALFLIKNE